MLKLDGVSAKYGKYLSIKDIGIDVAEGEIVVLLGANGAGKSTTFKTISGLLKASSGKILFNDEPIHQTAPEKIVQMGIVQCAEDRKLFPYMSVEQNLMMGGYIHRKRKAQLKQSLHDVFELFPILHEKRNEAAGLLSGGQQQMLAIGRAYMAKPKLMLLDEPSIGLAPLIVEQMFESIKNINQEGTTILLAEQNAFAALSIAKKGYVFENGQIALQGTADELLSNQEVRKAYIGA